MSLHAKSVPVSETDILQDRIQNLQESDDQYLPYAHESDASVRFPSYIEYKYTYYFMCLILYSVLQHVCHSLRSLPSSYGQRDVFLSCFQLFPVLLLNDYERLHGRFG